MNIRKGLSLPQELCKKFACLPEEQILLATRTHWFGMVFPLVGSGIAGTAATGTVLFLLFRGLLSIPHTAVLLLSIFVITISIMGFIFFTWYFHFYIVTNRKALEVRSLPYLYYNVNDVMLDQVRCTELDIQRNGLLRSLVNMGDITITFDRPTHQEEFTIANIHDPENVGIFLGDMLESIKETQKGSDQAIWYKEPTTNRYRFTDEIFPRFTPF